MKSDADNATKNWYQESVISKYVHLQWLILSGSLILVWLEQYKSGDGYPHLINQISFNASDLPWVPNNVSIQPIFGIQYFGDWILNLAWSKDPNCYLLSTSKCQTPPLGNLIFHLMSTFGYSLSYLIWTLMAGLLYWLGIKKLFRNISILTRLNIFLVLVLFTNGNIVSFDRGSVHFLVFSLVLTAYLKYQEGHFAQALIIYIIAISLKPQVTFCLVFLLFLKRYRHFIFSLFCAFLTNLIALLFFQGGYVDSLKGYLNATLSYTGSPATYPQIASSDSLIGIFTRYRELFKGSSSTIPFLANYRAFLILPGLVWLVLISILLMLRLVSENVGLLISLSSVSFVVPASNSYTLGWFSVAALLILASQNEHLNLLGNRRHWLNKLKLEYFFIGLILIVGLTPFFDLLIPLIIFQKVQPLMLLLPPFYLMLLLNTLRTSKDEAKVSNFRNARK